LAWLGVLHPQVALDNEFDLAAPPVVLEISVEDLFASAKNPRAVRPEPRTFPAAWRDIAILIDQKVSHRMIDEALHSCHKARYLRKAGLFDIYQGEHLAAGTKSMAYRLTFRSDEKTLNDKEIDREVQILLEWLSDKLGAVQRK
jgi:phenylalanyl-tRNA synthetase beta chain